MICLFWEGFKAHVATRVGDYVYLTYSAIAVVVLVGFGVGGGGRSVKAVPTTTHSVVETPSRAHGLRIALVVLSTAPGVVCFGGSLVYNSWRVWLIGHASMVFTFTFALIQSLLELKHSPTTTAWETANYAAWWASAFGLKWACAPFLFGSASVLGPLEVIVGLALSVPFYWAWTRRIRPAVYRHLHRPGQSEEEVLQWVEQQLVLTAEMIAAMLFAYMETVGCHWAMDTPDLSAALFVARGMHVYILLLAHF